MFQKSFFYKTPLVTASGDPRKISTSQSVFFDKIPEQIFTDDSINTNKIEI